MDPCTQGLLGASLAGSLAKKKELKVATICGGLGGLAPDLDVLIRSINDPLLFIEYHRHFTHSLAFIPFGGFFVALILYFFLRNKISFKHIYFFSTLGILTHGLLDACTSYGTSLFWPFSDFRVAWNIVSIIDPVYTLSLSIFVILCLKYKSIFLIRTGLILSTFYLAIGFIQNERVLNYIKIVAKKNGHKIERILLNPTIGNIILWRTVYQSEDFYYINAVYMPFFSDPLIKSGIKLKVINKETVFPRLGNDSIQREDVRRFSYFSQDFIYLHPEYENVIADLRYGTLPYDVKSLWGIKINIQDRDKHVIFKNLRNYDDKKYNEFWEMLKGNF